MNLNQIKNLAKVQSDPLKPLGGLRSEQLHSVPGEPWTEEVGWGLQQCGLPAGTHHRRPVRPQSEDCGGPYEETGGGVPQYTGFCQEERSGLAGVEINYITFPYPTSDED